jgi:AmmeMemoRadiSam system protein B
VTTRPPAVAGRFYAAQPGRLAADVDTLLAAPAPRYPDGVPPIPALRALVVPHAGYRYSGPTAGVAFRLLRYLRVRPARVILLGPAHFAPVAGMAVSSADAWATPLGEVAVDTEARERLLRAGRAGSGVPLVAVDDGAHAPEHSLEVALPFLQRTLPGLPVLPVLVGARDDEAAAETLEAAWADEATLVVVSTDLSHYAPLDVARRRDARTVAAICRAEADAVADEDACGARPLRVVLRLARRSGTAVRLLDLRTSADTAGMPDRVVGYGALALLR